jgi:hypothetical protein
MLGDFIANHAFYRPPWGSELETEGAAGRQSMRRSAIDISRAALYFAPAMSILGNSAAKWQNGFLVIMPPALPAYASRTDARSVTEGHGQAMLQMIGQSGDMQLRSRLPGHTHSARPHT